MITEIKQWILKKIEKEKISTIDLTLSVVNKFKTKRYEVQSYLIGLLVNKQIKAEIINDKLFFTQGALDDDELMIILKDLERISFIGYSH